MNNFKLLENQLAKWKPRPPSPELGLKLFAAPGREEISFGEALQSAWRILIPVMGCFLMVVGSLTPRQSHFSSLDSTNSLLAAGGHQLVRSFIPASPGHSAQNAPPKTAVEWTFGQQNSKTAHTYNHPAPGTNDLNPSRQ